MQPRHQATSTQPYQCDLQPQIQETQRTTHTGTTTRCRTQRKNPLRGNDRSRNRRIQEVPFIAGCSHLYARFRSPASSPKQSPCNMYAAITIRFAASRSKAASLYAHGNTKWQQSCSHSNAICNHRFKKRKELRTQEQPLVAEHRGGTHYARNDRSRNRRTHEVPFIAGCSHLYARFRSPASSPKQSPCNMYAAITIRFAASRSKPASLYTHGNTRWQQSYSHYTSVRYNIIKRILMWCHVSHQSLTPPFIDCILMWCQVSHHGLTPPFIECFLCDVKSHTTASHHPSLSVFLGDVMSHTTVSHHPSFSVFLCDVKSHTTVSHHPSLSVFSCDVKFHATVSHRPSLSVFLCDVKSHTTVSHHPSLSVFLCDAKSHTTVSHHPSLTVFLCDLNPSLSVFLCDVMSHTRVSHHPSLTVFLCDVKSHTTVSHHPSLSVFLCDVKCHTTVSHHPSLSVFLGDVKSHTTVSHHPSLSVLLQVKSHP